jgi:long-chain fatty acid transport protein
MKWLDLHFGAVYKSAIDMEYKGQLSSNSSICDARNGFFNEQWVQIILNNLLKWVLVHHIQWMDIQLQLITKKLNGLMQKGIKISVGMIKMLLFGYQYAQDNWALRAGYNHAKSPIKKQNGMTGARMQQ